MAEMERERAKDFIREIVTQDMESGKHKKIITRFPPEPNGYLHIGHAKALSIDFGVAEEFGGVCSLRFDDTNPAKEETEYVDAIQQDIRWMGFDWGDRLYFASGYFEQMYEWALQMIQKGKAYVCDLSAEELKDCANRGTLTQPGKDSPWRNRPVEENLDLFRRMREGEFQDGTRTLRAKIDMAHPNLNMRDPVMYRILHKEHHRTGGKWCIYPMYDWAHGLEDSIEGVTHSLCSLEYEDHRPLYDWFLDELGIYHPRQIEFARLNLNYTVMSKRKLLELVREKIVDGWDDPRMPTLCGLRRRGYTPAAIRDFLDRIGVAKNNSVVDYALLEHCLREDLNKSAPRVMAVLKPIKVVIENYPEDKMEMLDAENNPEDPSAGTRKVPFSRVIYIEEDDFREDPPKKYFRLSPGAEVRLKHAYYIKCVSVIKDGSGMITELRCTYDPESRGGGTPDGRRVKGTLHWVSAGHAISAEVNLYDNLFLVPDPDAGEYKASLNPESLIRLKQCMLEPGLKDAKPGDRFQFMRQGYFCVDPERADGKLVFNRTVQLTDTWAKIEKKG
ncbi:MAG: glutamine--tRNA ligase/YqeY domain fusion protein [Candidatus Wallbacteria bacterium]|nr:glutamine--tRNA ligase/YqeY domain fusion protein [Candidatus Wallbacteria bacterium]